MSSGMIDRARATGDQNYRGLWSPMVLQVKDDAQSEPLRSIKLAQTVVFLAGEREWENTCNMIGDFLDLHRDDLEILGRGSINQRRMSQGLNLLQLLGQLPVRKAWSWPVEQVLTCQATPELAPQPRALRPPVQGRSNPLRGRARNQWRIPEEQTYDGRASLERYEIV